MIIIRLSIFRIIALPTILHLQLREGGGIALRRSLGLLGNRLLIRLLLLHLLLLSLLLLLLLLSLVILLRILLLVRLIPTLLLRVILLRGRGGSFDGSTNGLTGLIADRRRTRQTAGAASAMTRLDAFASTSRVPLLPPPPLAALRRKKLVE